MPIILKPNRVKLKDQNGDYTSPVVFGDATADGRIIQLDAAVQGQQGVIDGITTVDYGANRIDMSKLAAGRIDLSTGEVLANNYYQTTDFCTVQGLLKLYVYVLKNGAVTLLYSSGFTGRYAFYNANKEFIESGQDTIPDLIPANAEYVRFSFTNTLVGQNDKIGLFGREISTWTDYRMAQYNTLVGYPSAIACIGDSLTFGSGGNGVSYPSVLASLLGYSYAVINDGVGGESSLEIMARQGARPAMVKPFTIPASGAVTIEFISTPVGRNIGVTTTASSAAINPVIINGIMGTINNTGDTYTFTRSAPGSAVSVTRPALVYCRPMLEDRPDIQILSMGTNGGWNNSGVYVAQNLISQYRLMIEYLSNINRPYMVLGLHYLYPWITGITLSEIDTAMDTAFGRRFINYRAYIVTPITDGGGNTVSCYGLDDAGITPTAADLEAIVAGTIPPSLMADEVHLNAAGYTIIGNLVYQRGKELGYWN